MPQRGSITQSEESMEAVMVGLDAKMKSRLKENFGVIPIEHAVKLAIMKGLWISELMTANMETIMKKGVFFANPNAMQTSSKPENASTDDKGSGNDFAPRKTNQDHITREEWSEFVQMYNLKCEGDEITTDEAVKFWNHMAKYEFTNNKGCPIVRRTVGRTFEAWRHYKECDEKREQLDLKKRGYCDSPVEELSVEQERMIQRTLLSEDGDDI